ncbi:elongation factor P [candidate division KSB1 bacterium]|nr:elongation factor P [candidate division KSB1 bacterium]
MASISDFHRGMAINFNNDIYLITEYQHVKPGKGAAFIRTKLKNVKTGRVIENTFRLNEKIEEVRLESKSMQYLYKDDENAYLMDTETYDQILIRLELFEDQADLLKEGELVRITYHQQTPMIAELPTTIDVEVTEAAPVVRGDTSGNLTNTVTVETGAQIQVPAFVKQGDIIRVDTRNHGYVSRV